MTRLRTRRDTGQVATGLLTIVTVVLSGALGVVAVTGFTQVQSQTPEPVSEPLVNYDGS